ncbi:racemase/epimerase [Aureococcus anophagefferens]|nr:racemase/epimerase [Aureococcus anophagefferens]
MDERLTNRFDYDGDYGTVLNRSSCRRRRRAATVYGTGGQTRGFIHVTDTAKCIELAINNPPAEGEGVEIFNQVAETRVRDIAEMISSNTGVPARFLANPRQEAAENELDKRALAAEADGEARSDIKLPAPSRR